MCEAAELPRLGVAEAAAILLVTARTDAERYERTALRWVSKLVLEAKDIPGDRFLRRGRSACRSEWRLINATDNLLKLYKHTTTPAAA